MKGPPFFLRRFGARRCYDTRRGTAIPCAPRGGELHAGFLDATLVDRVAVFVAPLLLGGRTAPSLVGGAGRPLKDAVRLGAFELTRLGPDVLLEADVAPASGVATPD